MSSAEKYPEFRLNQSRHDQTTFLGRFLHSLNLIDPRTLLVSEDKLRESIRLLEQFQNGTLPKDTTDEQLWEAQKIKQSTVHPDTGEKILMPFRMSGFVPFGSPIVTGMLVPNQSFPYIIFWQWLNQSHNAFVNYANRNATKPTSTSMFVKGYLGATAAALTISVGLSVTIRRAKRLSIGTRKLVERFVPYPAVATASVLNVLLMRQHELSQGIDVTDSSGTVIGTSQVAAKKALFEMAITRAVIPIPILLIPPIVMTRLEKTRFLKANPRFNLPINAVLATVSFAFGLPMGISLFPQSSKIKREVLETHIQEKTKEEILFFNKGL